MNNTGTELIVSKSTNTQTPLWRKDLSNFSLCLDKIETFIKGVGLEADSLGLLANAITSPTLQESNFENSSNLN